MLCNIFEFECLYVLSDRDFDDLSNKTYNEYFENVLYSHVEIESGEYEIIIKNITMNYVSKYIPVVIILGIFQLVFIIFCILLLKNGSWEWIAKFKLDNNNKNIHIIYQLEEILLLITISFLGIWIFMSEIYEIFSIGFKVYYEKNFYEKILEVFYNIFGIITIIPISIVFVAIRRRSKSLYILFNISSIIEISIVFSRLLWSFRKNYSYFQYYVLSNNQNNTSPIKLGDIKFIIDNDLTYREKFFIAIPTLIFLVILNINTYLCQIRIDENFISRIYGPKNKQILIQSVKEFLEGVLKPFLILLEKKSESYEYIKKLDINAWKFTPEPRILLLNIVSVSDEIGNFDNDKIDETKNIDHSNVNVESVGVEHEIHFNAKSDVMMQTNYPLLNINEIPLDVITLNMNTTISSQILPSSPPEEYWFLSSPLQINYWFYYYEITILSNPNNDKTIIAIGLATKKYSTNRLPGCNTHSVGFHSDQGRIFHNEKYTGSKYAEKWGEVNDVIGCGYCPNTGHVFFTMNGKNLGIAYTELFYVWYPTIGSNGVCSLKINFGQKEFKYNEANGMSVAGIISQELLNK
ncbi:concanavalin A-like lectin/glucanase domain-containing protein [Rhizophagus clarus]|nr:concanavalin A-like lectin/glucanase domain-containing protein [Rhizophagus clarus]